MSEKKRYHVAAGSYRVDTQKPMILEAYLGTCVGVALYDSVAGVGGLIHLLLPEPAGQNSSFQPEKYASTGFPPFVQTLYNKGATAENMKACIAGGALVGPIDDSDFEIQFVKGSGFECLEFRCVDLTNRCLANASRCLKTDKIVCPKQIFTGRTHSWNVELGRQLDGNVLPTARVTAWDELPLEQENLS